MSESNIVTVGPGEVIFAEGSTGDVFYLVIAGSVAITRGAAAARVDVTRVDQGDFFGEMAVIDPAPRSADATAGADGARLMLIDQARFLYLVSQQPAFALTIMERLSRRLRDANAALALARARAGAGASA